MRVPRKITKKYLKEGYKRTATDIFEKGDTTIKVSKHLDKRGKIVWEGELIGGLPEFTISKKKPIDKNVPPRIAQSMERKGYFYNKKGYWYNETYRIKLTYDPKNKAWSSKTD